jgi:hypothetical protein
LGARHSVNDAGSALGRKSGREFHVGQRVRSQVIQRRAQMSKIAAESATMTTQDQVAAQRHPFGAGQRTLEFV